MVLLWVVCWGFFWGGGGQELLCHKIIDRDFLKLH